MKAYKKTLALVLAFMTAFFTLGTIGAAAVDTATTTESDELTPPYHHISHYIPSLYFGIGLDSRKLTVELPDDKYSYSIYIDKAENLNSFLIDVDKVIDNYLIPAEGSISEKLDSGLKTYSSFTDFFGNTSRIEPKTEYLVALIRYGTGDDSDKLIGWNYELTTTYAAKNLTSGKLFDAYSVNGEISASLYNSNSEGYMFSAIVLPLEEGAAKYQEIKSYKQGDPALAAFADELFESEFSTSFDSNGNPLAIGEEYTVIFLTYDVSGDYPYLLGCNTERATVHGEGIDKSEQTFYSVATKDEIRVELYRAEKGKTYYALTFHTDWSEYVLNDLINNTEKGDEYMIPHDYLSPFTEGVSLYMDDDGYEFIPGESYCVIVLEYDTVNYDYPYILSYDYMYVTLPEEEYSLIDRSVELILTPNENSVTVTPANTENMGYVYFAVEAQALIDTLPNIMTTQKGLSGEADTNGVLNYGSVTLTEDIFYGEPFVAGTEYGVLALGYDVSGDVPVLTSYGYEFFTLETPSYPLGDVNLDGAVNIKDATAIQKYLTNTIVLSDDALFFADFDKNGVVNIKDATAIQKFLAQ